MNYHGFAAKLLDRYGMLAGIEPDQRVLSPAQRTELCARVMDLMTFEHVKTERQGGVIDNILLLDDQASNHRRTPEEIIAFNEEPAGAAAGASLRPRVPRRAGADRAGEAARRSSGS